MSWIVIILLIGLGILGGLAVLAWYFLAPTNRYFTFVKEGTAKVMVKGDAFVGALIQWKGHTFDDEWNIVPDGTQKEGKTYREPYHLLGGFRNYGFWPIKDIYIYWFKWSGVAEDGQVISHPPELIDFVLLKDDVYWAKVEQAEDKNLLPLDIGLVLTIRIMNPRKALFEVQNWLETVINRMKPQVRDRITQDEFGNWIKKKEDLGREIYDAAGELLTEFRDRYGVDIRKIQIKDINPPEGYREKTLAPYLADLEKQATIIKAEGEKRATVTKAEGEEERIEKVFSRIARFGDLGKLVRTLEAVEKSPLAASLTVQAVPGLPEALRGIFGRPPGEVSPQEFRRLRETVERMSKKMEETKK